MASDKSTGTIFSTSHHFTHGELIRYCNQQLSGQELHAMEKHLVDCELCSTALKGVSEMKNFLLLADVSKDLHLRARRKKLWKKNIFSQNELIAIFAVVFLLVFLFMVTLFFFVRKDVKQLPEGKVKMEEKK